MDEKGDSIDDEDVKVEEKGKNKRKRTGILETKCNNKLILLVNILIKICTFSYLVIVLRIVLSLRSISFF